jgi:DNA-binding CsgD family transcriptional regulator
MHPSGKQVEAVLDLIYDAAAENHLWRDALTAIADLTDSQGGILFGQSMTARQVYFDYNGRLDEACNRAYQERHMSNPWSDHMEHQPVGRLVLSDEAVSLSKLRRSSFYDEVLRPQNVAHNAMIALAARRDFRAAFNLCRGEKQGPIGTDQQRMLRSLTPHLRRSISLGFRIDGYLAIQRAAFDLLDRLTDGVIILDRNAYPLYANTSARRLEAAGVLKLRQTLALSSPVYSRRMSTLVQKALAGEPGGAMSVIRSQDEQRITIFVSSIRSKDLGRLSDAGIKNAAVLVFVVDPASRGSIQIRQIVEAYGLTHAEARVAIAASSGGTVEETARLLHLSPNTIKTHLSRVFAKTATARQAELARLVAAMGALRLPAHTGE